LREVATDEGVSGYPARAVGSVVFRNPVNDDPPRGMLRIREMYANWLLIFGRTGNFDYKLLHEDVSRSNGVSVEDLKLLETTPAALGGLGMYPPGPVGVKIAVSEDVQDWSFTSTPKILRSLADTLVTTRTDAATAVKYLEKKWLKAIFPQALVRQRKEPDAAERIQVPTPLDAEARNYLSSGIPLSPNVNPRLGPSKAEAVRELEPLETWWMTEESKTDAILVKKRCMRRVYLDWVKGNLPFSPPTVPNYLPAIVGQQYKLIARTWWAWCLTHTKVTYDLVVKAAIRAEDETRLALRGRNSTEGIVINA